MAQEIYHRSEWGNPTETWGNTYLNADLTNELYKRASEYENSWVTDQLLNGVGIKPSIILTPTAYEDGVLNSVKPNKTLGSELVTNGGFDTDSDWGKISSTIINGVANIVSVDGSYAGVTQNILTLNKTYKYSLEIKEITGTLSIYMGNGVSAGGTDSFTTVGLKEGYLVANGTTGLFQVARNGICNATIDNVSVKEVIDADFDFTRGSSATRVNEKGLVQDVQLLSGELVQNGDFEQIGSELVTNGSFDTDSGWSKSGSVEISNGSANFDIVDGVFTRISQTISLTNGKTYKLTLQVLGDNSAKQIYVRDTASGDNGGLQEIITLAEGTTDYTFYFTANANSNAIYIKRQSSSGDYQFSIDNVSVKEVGQNWTFGSGWSIEDGKLIGDGAESNTFQSGVVQNGNTYKITLTAYNITTGYISVRVGSGGTENYQVNSNGTQTFIATADNGNLLLFRNQSGFDGYIDNVSVIEITDDTDLPRINYTDGEGSLLLEPQRTNLLPNSTNFSGSNWFNFQSATTLNQYNSLTNLNNATLFYPTVSSAYASLYDTTNTTNGIFTRSVFAKANGKDFLCIDDTVGGLNWFNLSNGTLGTINSNYDAEIISYGGGWYRCSVTNKSAATYNYLVVYLVTNADNSTTITANGTDGILLFGGQLEQGSYATSYIPTNGSTVTRLADVCNNSGNSDLINSTEGVLYAEISALANDGTNRLISLSDGTADERLFLQYSSTDNRLQFLVKNGGSTQCNIIYDASDLTAVHKVAAKYKANDFALWVDGVEIGTDTSGNVASGLSKLQFDRGYSGLPFYGNVKCVAVFKEALSDTELQKLTTI